ncbi:MAG TPA: fibronectin type III domain-containing protein, partial [Nitrospiria bacterium]
FFGGYMTMVFAGDAVLSWDPNSEPDLAGYKVYYGTAPGSYGTPIDVGNQTAYTVMGLGYGTYYFAVKAYDATGNQSGYSNEVTKIISDTIPPVISAMTTGSITGTSAAVNWSTDEPATSLVEYGTTTAYGNSTPFNSSLVTGHSQTVGGLQAATVYHYRIRSADATGNVAVSGDNTFTTSAAPDTQPPVISGVTASNLTGTGAVITWMTNEAATPRVEYGTSANYGSSSALVSTLATSHSITLNGLAPSTPYHFRVMSGDAAGNSAASADNIFITTTTPDTTPPQISGILTNNVTGSSATVTWATDEAATTQVEYGTTTAYGSATTLNPVLVTGHTQTLTGLQSNLPYHYRVKSSDGAGNLSVSGDRAFTTGSIADTTPPQNVQSFTAHVGDQQITLNWVNPPDLDFIGVRIRYRTDHYPSAINDGALLGDFTGQPSETMSTTQTSLQNGITYYYSASSYDNHGNYQTTAYASATVSASSSNASGSPDEVTMSGGCGMVRPGNGRPPGPGQAADMTALLAVLLIAILKREIQKKKGFDRRLIVSGIICISFPSRKSFQPRNLQGLYFERSSDAVLNNQTHLFLCG